MLRAPARCVCGGHLAAPNRHGIMLCALCGGTTDGDGAYVADPRTLHAPPIHAPTVSTGDLDVEKLCRAYLKAADDLQRLMLPPEEQGDLPQYDDLAPRQQDFVVATMTRAIEEWLGLAR
jgi:hypothetical protein